MDWSYRLALPVIVISTLVACGGSDPEATSVDAAVTAPDGATTEVGEDAAPDAPLEAGGETGAETGGAYDVAYVAVGSGLTVGKSRYQLRVSRGGAPATGLAGRISIVPLMTMAKMSHGNPVPPDAVKESGTPGTYDVTGFFTMASVDESGGSLGQWTLKVAVDEQAPAPLDVMVARATGSETTHGILKNAADTFNAMGTPKMRSWVLFRDTLEAKAGAHELRLFLATVQEGMLVWPPVTTGLKLVDGAGKVQLTVETLAVSASADGTTWTPMTCDANARCTATIAGVASTGKIRVKLQVNGKDYTTDGAAPNGSTDPTKNNGWFTFTVTP
ncbi:MAG: hypothetical protein HYV09_37210 [Deltaproteobacteria bacterium]|nr:hypothetical protein [Deltaproteobacteria bacterium]